MDAQTLSSLPPKLLAQYLRDPQALMSQEMQNQGTDTSPVKSPWEGVSRLGKAALGGYMSNKLRGDYEQKGQAVSDERKQAMAMALQNKDYMGASAALSSPDNMDLANTMFGAKLNQDQTAAQQEFQQAQQDRQFGQQRQMQDMQLARQTPCRIRC